MTRSRAHDLARMGAVATFVFDAPDVRQPIAEPPSRISPPGEGTDRKKVKAARKANRKRRRAKR